MAHSPLKMFKSFHTSHCLVSGQGPIVEIAKYLGFTRITTIEDLRQSFPNLDVVDHKRRLVAVIIFMTFSYRFFVFLFLYDLYCYYM
jgi:hypothetical protein